MKVYLSTDIEGITGTTHWDEANKAHADYAEFQKQMTAEVAAACEGALEAGATEVWIQDAHDSARNILAAKLPRQTRLLRGWSGHPYLMMSGIDSSFSAAAMIGYHARAGAKANPLQHTLTGQVMFIKINDSYASEFMINAYTAALEDVPVVFVSGDAGLCAEADALVPNLSTVAVKEGLGNSTASIHPATAVEQIRAGMIQALTDGPEHCRLTLPEHIQVEIGYKGYDVAYKKSFYPGARLADGYTLHFESNDYFEVLRLFAFVL
jgi:D-amino peptidase